MDYFVNYAGERPEPIMVMPVQGPKVTASVWGPCDEYIITGHENGLLCKWDVKVFSFVLDMTSI